MMRFQLLDAANPPSLIREIFPFGIIAAGIVLAGVVAAILIIKNVRKNNQPSKAESHKEEE